MKYQLVITDFVLVRRIETMMIYILVWKKDKLEFVIRDTLDMIEKRYESEVCDANLEAYVKNLEMALYLSYLGCADSVMTYVQLAADVIDRNLGIMTPAYMMVDRMYTFDEDKIGTLAYLPNDILAKIGNMTLEIMV